MQCDYRLSRAAREIVRSHLHHAWREAHRHHQTTARTIGNGNGNSNNNNNRYNLDVSEWNVWQLLESMIVKPSSTSFASSAQQNDCKLRPELDVLRAYEEMGRVVVRDTRIPVVARYAAIPGVLHAGRTSRERGPQDRALHKCAVCGKTFTSLYYLDEHHMKHHMNRHQSSTMSSNSSNNEVDEMNCPAESWCAFLSLEACHDMAEALEPFYGSGNAESGPIVPAPPCSQDALEHARVQCREVVSQCFGDNDGGAPWAGTTTTATTSTTIVIQDYLHDTLCAPHDCHGRLHRLVSSSTQWLSSPLPPPLHESRDAWDAYEKHALGWLGMLVVTSLVVGYSWYWYSMSAMHTGRRQRSTLRRQKKQQQQQQLTNWKRPTTWVDGKTKSKRL